MRLTIPNGPPDVVVPPITVFDTENYIPMNIEDWVEDIGNDAPPGADNVLNGSFIIMPRITWSDFAMP